MCALHTLTAVGGERRPLKQWMRVVARNFFGVCVCEWTGQPLGDGDDDPAAAAPTAATMAG